MEKQLIFVDDSGDPGFKETSSNNFVMAAAVFMDIETAEAIMAEMDNYRESLGWGRSHEFKFAKNHKEVIFEMLRRAAKYNFSVYAVYIDKKDFRDITLPMYKFFDKEKLYNWMIKELLLDIPLGNTKITIDGRSSKQNMKNTKTYLRHEIGGGSNKIDIKFEDSVKTDLLQLADLISGAINRSLQFDKTDSGKYISVFKKRLVKLRKISFK